MTDAPDKAYSPREELLWARAHVAELETALRTSEAEVEALRSRASRYDAFAANVMMEMTRRLAKEAQKGKSERLEALMSAIGVLEAEFPEAKAELDRRHPTGAALQGETPQ